MRWLLTALLAACGGDRPTIEESPGDASQLLGDASVDDDASPLGDAAPLDDADARPATLCDEATQHSDLAWIEANVFVPRCAGCHGGDEPDAGLRLGAGLSRANLVNVTSSTVGTPWMRVKPGAASDSYLMVALGRAEGPPPSLGFMPLGSEPLCTQIHEAIERWIAAGAQ